MYWGPGKEFVEKTSFTPATLLAGTHKGVCCKEKGAFLGCKVLFVSFQRCKVRFFPVSRVQTANNPNMLLLFAFHFYYFHLSLFCFLHTSPCFFDLLSSLRHIHRWRRSRTHKQQEQQESRDAPDHLSGPIPTLRSDISPDLRRSTPALELCVSKPRLAFSYRNKFGGWEMDIISQLQEQVNTIASLAFNTFGTLQRDAPPVQLSPNYPEPPANATSVEDATNLAEQPKLLSAELVKAAKQFDALVAALPLSEGGEEAQLKRIAELQAENDAIGQELQKQLEAAEKELRQVQELFSQATDNCLNLKKPE
ncbi:Mediator of RNA polymerase II transcription subunit [Sesamum angolense]|uniref:Mediator of RNA polymerase II transcription subunit 21 n=1 Tax=Sesamum angolense TaxID=2727404 RepID=A0AAE2BV44_9LAMI|nr:Mediator of RNA polymerase II transcription subunit [Sesamum angolense]